MQMFDTLNPINHNSPARPIVLIQNKQQCISRSAFTSSAPVYLGPWQMAAGGQCLSLSVAWGSILTVCTPWGASLGGISRPLASPSIMNESDQKFAQFSVLLTEAFQHTICLVRGQGRPWNILNVSNCWLLSIELNGGNSRLYISTIQRRCESQHCDGETNKQLSSALRLTVMYWTVSISSSRVQTGLLTQIWTNFIEIIFHSSKINNVPIVPALLLSLCDCNTSQLITMSLRNSVANSPQCWCDDLINETQQKELETWTKFQVCM